MNELINLVIAPYIRVIYVAVALLASIYIGQRLTRRWGAESRWKARGAGLVIFLLLVLGPVWDVLLAKAYMHTRCLVDGGVHIYHTIQVPPELFDERGWPDFVWHYKSNGGAIKCISEHCFDDISSVKVVVTLGSESKVIRRVHLVSEADTGLIMGRRISYVRKVSRNFDSIAESCPGHVSGESLDNVFVRTNGIVWE